MQRTGTPMAAPNVPALHASLATVSAGDMHDVPLREELDISFSSHLTVVVPARLDFASGQTKDVSLVLPRSRIGRGGARRPCRRILLDAAQHALGRIRLSLRPLSLSARTDGQRRALCAWPDADAAA